MKGLAASCKMLCTISSKTHPSCILARRRDATYLMSPTLFLILTGELALTTKKHDHLSYYGFMWDVRAVRRSIAVRSLLSPKTQTRPSPTQCIPLPSSIFSRIPLFSCALGCKSALDAYQMLHTGGRSPVSR